MDDREVYWDIPEEELILPTTDSQPSDTKIPTEAAPKAPPAKNTGSVSSPPLASSAPAPSQAASQPPSIPSFRFAQNNFDVRQSADYRPPAARPSARRFSPAPADKRDVANGAPAISMAPTVPAVGVTKATADPRSSTCNAPELTWNISDGEDGTGSLPPGPPVDAKMSMSPPAQPLPPAATEEAGVPPPPTNNPTPPQQDAFEMAPRRACDPSATPASRAVCPPPSAPLQQAKPTATPPIASSAITTADPPTFSTGPVQSVVVVSGVAGRLSLLNELARQHQCRAIIHTGNFGFYDAQSHARLPARELCPAVESALGPDATGKLSDEQIKAAVAQQTVLLSELPDFFEGRKRLEVPVYVVWGQHEDLSVIEKFRKGVYHVPNLYLLDSHNSYSIATGTLTLRLFGLGGSYEYDNLFDIGQGRDGIVSGTDGQVWASIHQMGELLELADRLQDPSEVRLFVSQASPIREPLAHLLASALGARFSVSSASSTTTTICSVLTDDSVRTEEEQTAWLATTKTEIKSSWEQIYFASHEKFSDALRKSCTRFIACLERPTEQALPCVHLNICPLRNGQAQLKLRIKEVTVETGFAGLSPPAEDTTAIPLPDSSVSSAAAEQPLPPASATTPATRSPKVEPGRSSWGAARNEGEEEGTGVRLENGSRKPALYELSDSLPSATSRIVDFRTDNSRGGFGRRPHDRAPRGGRRYQDSVPSSAAAPYYFDKSPSDQPRENSLFIGNLPYDATEEMLTRELALSSFAVERVDFVGFRNCNALIKFQTAAEMSRARTELANRQVLGRSVAVRPANE